MIAMVHVHANQATEAAKFNECPVAFYDAVQLMMSFRLRHQDSVMKIIQTAIVLYCSKLPAEHAPTVQAYLHTLIYMTQMVPYFLQKLMAPRAPEPKNDDMACARMPLRALINTELWFHLQMVPDYDKVLVFEVSESS